MFILFWNVKPLKNDILLLMLVFTSEGGILFFSCSVSYAEGWMEVHQPVGRRRAALFLPGGEEEIRRRSNSFLYEFRNKQFVHSGHHFLTHSYMYYFALWWGKNFRSVFKNLPREAGLNFDELIDIGTSLK